MSNVTQDNHVFCDMKYDVSNITENSHKHFEVDYDMDDVTKTSRISIDTAYDMWHVANLSQYDDDFATHVIIIKIKFLNTFWNIKWSSKEIIKKKVGTYIIGNQCFKCLGMIPILNYHYQKLRILPNYQFHHLLLQ